MIIGKCSYCKKSTELNSNLNYPSTWIESGYYENFDGKRVFIKTHMCPDCQKKKQVKSQFCLLRGTEKIF